VACFEASYPRAKRKSNISNACASVKAAETENSSRKARVRTAYLTFYDPPKIQVSCIDNVVGRAVSDDSSDPSAFKTSVTTYLTEHRIFLIQKKIASL